MEEEMEEEMVKDEEMVEVLEEEEKGEAVPGLQETLATASGLVRQRFASVVARLLMVAWTLTVCRGGLTLQRQCSRLATLSCCESSRSSSRCGACTSLNTRACWCSPCCGSSGLSSWKSWRGGSDVGALL